MIWLLKCNYKYTVIMKKYLDNIVLWPIGLLKRWFANLVSSIPGPSSVNINSVETRRVITELY